MRALASPLFKWCRSDATPGRMDRFGFPARVPAAARAGYVQRALEVADLLGTSLVRIFSNLTVEERLTEPLVDDELLSTALAYAAEAEITLLVENEPVCTASTAQQLSQLLDAYAPQGLRCWLDLANLHQVGDANPEVVAALAPHTAYVHIKDYRASAAERRFCPAGMGEIPYDTLLPVLDRHAPEPAYGIETHVRDTPADAIAGTAAYLRQALEGSR